MVRATSMKILRKIIKIIKNPRSLYESINYRIAPLAGSKPPNDRYSYSDMFFWRCDIESDTLFSYTPYVDIISLGKARLGSQFRRAKLLILSSNGDIIKNIDIETLPLTNKHISIRDVLGSNYIENQTNNYGSFLIFHENVPDSKFLEGGFLAERGYVSYRFSGINTSSFVHGNLDAISNEFKNTLLSKMIPMRSSVFKRRIDLQLLFKNDFKYDLCFTNPTNSNQQVTLNVFDTSNHVLEIINFSIQHYGSFLYTYVPRQEDTRIRIYSKHPFPRPLIFLENRKGYRDVFHG